MKNKAISLKKILSVLVAAVMITALLPAAFVSAADISKIEQTVIGGKITVSGEVPNTTENSHVLLLVTPAGVTPSYDNPDDIVALGYTQSKTNPNGNGTGYRLFNFETLIPDSVPTGRYNVSISIADTKKDPIVSTINYVGYNDREAVLAVYNDESTVADELKSAIEKVSGVIGNSGSDEDIYKALSEAGKKKYAELMLDYRADGETYDIAGFGVNSNEALLVSAITSASRDSEYKNALEAINRYAKLIGLDVEDPMFSSINQADNLVTAIRAQNSDMETKEDVQAAFEDALYLARLNECAPLAYLNFIDENNDFFLVDDSDLNTIRKSSNITRYFSEAIRAKLPVYTLEDFHDIFKDSLDEAKKKNSTGGTSGGGTGSGGTGGGSSSRGNGTVSSTVTVDPGLVRDDPLDKKILVTEYYDDVDDYEWAHSAILALTQAGIISGTGNNKFEPARTLKREEFMKLLVNTFNLADITATCSFTDVTDKDAWYYMYIASAEKAGITSGRGDGTFGLGDDVTREEMATLVYRAAVKANLNIYGNYSAFENYTDVNDISDYAVEAISALTASGIVSGNGNGQFSPKVGASRAQAAVVINNIKKYIA